jgi:hypothetical protein
MYFIKIFHLIFQINMLTIGDPISCVLKLRNPSTAYLFITILTRSNLLAFTVTDKKNLNY